MVAPYVSVPLRWGVWAAPDSPITSLEDLDAGHGPIIFGISRFGSGSHLMATIMANARGWDPERVSFAKPCGSLDGLEAAVASGAASLFMWNHSTTKPLADAGRLRHVGDCFTPWPCFMIAVSRALLEHNRPALDAMLATIKDAARTFVAEGEASVDFVVKKHGIARQDAADWFASVGYAESNHIDDAVLSSAITALRATKIIDTVPARDDLVADLGPAVVVEGGHVIPPPSHWEYAPAEDESFTGLICAAASPVYGLSWAEYEPSSPVASSGSSFMAFM
ncbi:periplasmic substrate-binding protein [Thecamonas trahens ATCC 50062]|uniref:Periplasmic substrate-binding protein n=1 Tax=Thecamonas trahens ATCC 50062 TaxID=461836 RepID=A0A0L0DGT2_THETB|nr:periplasmic substrate-binding protein [Thecamonas trahens ATCC 50062]KNC51405.1 periplasmic substrate-binding protein [Thecamonas trahens ATCC 50062]|eukprot:XP_013756072.1 periplasmic substrate-binding protein [Thecamonas trahens ATCC 50062]